MSPASLSPACAASARYVEPPLNRALVAARWQAWRECGGGTGLPLLLLHGIGSNSRAWAGQFAGFGQERRVIAWNAPGYAESDPLSTPWPIPGDYGAAAVALLDHLAIDRCIVIGQSLGAIMATALALRAPERVAALALASPASGYGVRAGDALPEKVQRRIDDVRAFGARGLADRRAHALLTAEASPDALAIVHGAMAEVMPGGYAQAVRLLATSELIADVSRLDLPGCVLWGAADIITPPTGCRAISKAFRGAQAVEIAGFGHGFATEAPELFNDAIRSLITAADARE